MSRILTITGIAFLLILVGFPVPAIANGIGFLLLAFAAFATIVSATEVARKSFIAAIALFALGQVFPVLRSIAWSVAPFVFACLALGLVAYIAGVRAWKKLTSDRAEAPAKAEKPKIRARSDLPPELALPPMPEPDERPFNIFGSQQRGRR